MVSVRALTPLALLALLPVLAFLFDRGEPFVAAALVNVLLIAGALWLMFGADSEPLDADSAPR